MFSSMVSEEIFIIQEGASQCVWNLLLQNREKTLSRQQQRILAPWVDSLVGVKHPNPLLGGQSSVAVSGSKLHPVGRQCIVSPELERTCHEAPGWVHGHAVILQGPGSIGYPDKTSSSNTPVNWYQLCTWKTSSPWCLRNKDLKW